MAEGHRQVQEPSFHERADRRWRPGAWAFLAALAIHGFPFGRDLVVSEQQHAAQRHIAVLEGATSLGLQNTWVVAAIWSALYLAAAIAIFRRGQRSFLGALRRQWPLTLLTALIAASVLWAAYVQPVAMNAVHAIGVTMVAFAASMYYWDKQPSLVRQVALVLGLNVVVQIGSVLLMPSMTVAYDGRWSGLTDNANTLGALAGLTLWASIAAALLSEGRIRLAYIGFSTGALIALYGTNSLTATFSSTTAIAGLLLLLRFPILSRRSTLLVLMIAPLVFLVAWAGIGLLMDKFLPALGRTADLTGRVSIWSDAIGLIRMNPLLGWGFDNNARVIEQSGLATVHFHNGYLDLTIRGGVLALVLLLLSFYFVTLHLRKKSAVASAIGLSFLLLILTYNVTEVAFLAPRNPVWLLFLCVAFSSIPRQGMFIR